MPKKPKRRCKASKAKQPLASNQHSYQAHFKQTQKKMTSDYASVNELGRNTGKIREIERYFSLKKQAFTEETQRFLIRRNANIQFFLVVCATVAFFAYYGFSLYTLFLKGDARYILGDVPAVRYFWKMVNHFVFRK